MKHLIIILKDYFIGLKYESTVSTQKSETIKIIDEWEIGLKAGANFIEKIFYSQKLKPEKNNNIIKVVVKAFIKNLKM